MSETAMMTDEEREIAERIQAPFVKLLPCGGYLALNRASRLLTFDLVRSNQGDYAGWTEQWMFEDLGLALQAMALRLKGETPLGWTRHIYINAQGHSVTERPLSAALEAFEG